MFAVGVWSLPLYVTGHQALYGIAGLRYLLAFLSRRALRSQLESLRVSLGAVCQGLSGSLAPLGFRCRASAWVLRVSSPRFFEGVQRCFIP